jgi:hypothetical protein
MQKIIASMLALLSITATLCAQQKEIFSLPSYSIDIDYTIQLDRGNQLQIQLANGSDLRIFENIDSLLLVFLGDMKAFRDSLSDPMTVKRIDYLIDTSGQRKLRIRQTRPTAASFLLEGNEPAILRLEQDTVFIMVVTPVARHGEGKNINGLRYDRLRFLLNRYSELEGYVANGLNDKIREILSKVIVPYRHPFDYIVRQPGISTRYRHFANQLSIKPAVAIQNYKNYFAPSVALGATMLLDRGKDEYRFGADWEPLFFFAPNAQGRLQTYRNDFIVVNFEHNRLDREDGGDVFKPVLPVFNFYPAFSFGYLIRSQGDYFNRPSFRLTAGAGKMLHGAIRLEPCLYFDHFLKGVTPGLRPSFGGF